MKIKWPLLLTSTIITVLYLVFQYQQADAIANSISPIIDDSVNHFKSDLEPDDLILNTGNKKTAKADTIQIPKAKRIDPELENEMRSLLEVSGCEKWKGQILEITILDKDWFVERHKLTGAILYRYIRAEVAVKTAKTCWLYQLVTFKQDYIKNAFSKIYCDGTDHRMEIPCDNIK